MSVSEKIKNNEYDTKFPWVSRSSDREKHEERRLDESRLLKIFQRDLEEEYGLVGHPKAQNLYDLAWSYGHSSGLGSVVDYYNEFSDLLA